MTDTPRVYVAGHRGLVGSAMLRRLREKGYDSCVTRTRSELDLLDAAATEAFFRSERPEWVFLAAAKVGGIYANNTWPADFIRDNLTVQTNVVTSIKLIARDTVEHRVIAMQEKKRALISGLLDAENPALNSADWEELLG